MGDECTPEMYAKARDILISAQAVSVSLLQRQMKIGYGVALLLMDALERNGVVTPLNEDGCRTLMLPYRMTR
jgi:S-DNA-T family DNA segregation ATPase FtsK/SpoIIIE